MGKRNRKSEVISMAAAVVSTATDELSALDALLAEIDPDNSGKTETPAEALTPDVIEAAATDAVVNDAPVAAPVEDAPAEPKAKAKGARVKKEKTEATPKAPRVFFGKNKMGRLEHRLGDKLNDFFVLTMTDAALDGDELAAKQTETRTLIQAMGDKVKNRATNLIEFLSGKSERLNNVIATALRLLATDGKLVTGDKGNLHQTLLAKPYSPSAARAMGNNTVAMLRQLKLIEKVSDGYVANGDSVLLGIAASKLSLVFGSSEGSADAGEPAPAPAVEQISDADIEALV